MKSIYQQYRVTPEQVDACTRYVDEARQTVLYLVPSAHEEGLFYRVEWDRQFSRFSCTCKANQNGLSCWHIRAALVHATLYAEAKRAEEGEATQMRLTYHSEHPAEYAEAEIQRDQQRYAPRPFCLMRGGE